MEELLFAFPFITLSSSFQIVLSVLLSPVLLKVKKCNRHMCDSLRIFSKSFDIGIKKCLLQFTAYIFVGFDQCQWVLIAKRNCPSSQFEFLFYDPVRHKSYSREYLFSLTLLCFNIRCRIYLFNLLCFWFVKNLNYPNENNGEEASCQNRKGIYKEECGYVKVFCLV